MALFENYEGRMPQLQPVLDKYGFKDFESFTKGKVKKEMKKGLRELEKTLNNSRRSPDGSLKMVTGVNDDPESFIGKGFKLDI